MDKKELEKENTELNNAFKLLRGIQNTDKDWDNHFNETLKYITPIAHKMDEVIKLIKTTPEKYKLSCETAIMSAVLFNTNNPAELLNEFLDSLQKESVEDLQTVMDLKERIHKENKGDSK